MLSGDGLTHRRRTLYGLVDRQFFPTVLRVFDMANPDLHVPSRSETTVPQQALFALNHPFVAEHAKEVVDRSGAADLAAGEAVRALYRHVLQREPTNEQLTRSVDFLEAPFERAAPSRVETRAWQYGYGPLDPETGILASFNPLPHFTGDAWQGGPAWPDPTLGWVQITADGGHTGNDLAHSSVRRWIAPHDGMFTVTSEVEHDVEAGDGIRCHLLVSGERLATAVVHHDRGELTAGPLALSAGDTIDFVADVRDSLNSDQHRWTAVIEDVGNAKDGDARDASTEPVASRPNRWSSQADFAGPEPERLSRLEQLAQVLLISNETLFVD
jgi:hypothetical protein